MLKLNAFAFVAGLVGGLQCRSEIAHKPLGGGKLSVHVQVDTRMAMHRGNQLRKVSLGRNKIIFIAGRETAAGTPFVQAEMHVQQVATKAVAFLYQHHWITLVSQC